MIQLFMIFHYGTDMKCIATVGRLATTLSTSRHPKKKKGNTAQTFFHLINMQAAPHRTTPHLTVSNRTRSGVKHIVAVIKLCYMLVQDEQELRYRYRYTHTDRYIATTSMVVVVVVVVVVTPGQPILWPAVLFIDLMGNKMANKMHAMRAKLKRCQSQPFPLH